MTCLCLNPGPAGGPTRPQAQPGGWGRIAWIGLMAFAWAGLVGCTNSEFSQRFAKKMTAGWSPDSVDVYQGRPVTVTLGLSWLPEVRPGAVTFKSARGLNVARVSQLTCTPAGDFCNAQLEVRVEATAEAAPGETLVEATISYEDQLTSQLIETSASLIARVMPSGSSRLSVQVQGSGRVTSDPAALTCEATTTNCSAAFNAAAPLSLLATPEPGWRVAGAEGDCQALGGLQAQSIAVRLQPDAPSNCRVRFTASRLVDLKLIGPGQVQVGSTTCQDSCAVDVGSADSTSLLAQPATDARWVGWAGDCTGAANEYTLHWAALGRAAASCTASFQANASSRTVNLVLNPGFEQGVSAGTLPSLAGIWQGDATNTVPAEGGVAPHGGGRMLKFIATGAQASAILVSSQMWQIVDLRAWAGAIDAGGVRLDAGAWFHRVTGGANTDRRFDLRVLAFDTTDAGVPQRYQANAALAVGATTVDTTGAAWQQASLQLVLPPLTRVVLVEIYAYEDVLNDAQAPEFDGHYADDVVLTLTLP